MLVGTKKDEVTREDGIQGKDSEMIGVEQAGVFCKEIGGFASLQCSAKDYVHHSQTKGNVEKVFKAAIKAALVSANFLAEDRRICRCCYDRFCCIA